MSLIMYIPLQDSIPKWGSVHHSTVQVDLGEVERRWNPNTEIGIRGLSPSGICRHFSNAETRLLLPFHLRPNWLAMWYLWLQGRLESLNWRHTIEVCIRHLLLIFQNRNPIVFNAAVSLDPIDLPCDTCDYKADSKWALKTHNRSLHQASVATFPKLKLGW